MTNDDKYISIEGHPEYVKDKKSGAILNVDNTALKQYKTQRAEKILNDKRMNKMEKDIDSLKNLLINLAEELRKK